MRKPAPRRRRVSDDAGSNRRSPADRRAAPDGAGRPRGARRVARQGARPHGRAGHRREVGGSLAGGGRAPRSSSASPAARSSRSTTRCWTPRRFGTSWSGTSRAPGHAATGYAQATGKVGVCMATSGPGATNLVTPIADAQHGLGADGRDHRAGGPRDDRHGRLPGGRHLRHHDADHQAQLPRHRPGRHPTDDRGRVPPGIHRPTRPGAGGHPQGRSAVGDHLRLAAGHPPARATGRPCGRIRGQITRRRQADRRRAATGALRRRRGDQGRGATEVLRSSPS